MLYHFMKSGKTGILKFLGRCGVWHRSILMPKWLACTLECTKLKRKTVCGASKQHKRQRAIIFGTFLSLLQINVHQPFLKRGYSYNYV